jgi:chemotaxis protein histidine kinase CheA
MSVTRVQVVERLSKMYGFNAEEAMMRLSTKKIEKASTLVPFVKKVEGWCDGLKQNKNLFTQCTNKPMKDGDLCRTCQKTADESGKPKCGLASEREAQGELWRDPKGREPIHFGNVFNKGNYKKEEVLSEMKRLYGIEESDVDEGLFEKHTRRGRPRKVTTEVETSDEEKPKKTRGRPRKSGKVVNVECSDLIDALMEEAKAEDVEPTEENTNEEKPKKKVARKGKLTAEEKEAAKQAKLAEKEAAKQAKLAEKEAAKQAKKAEKLAEKEAAKQAKKAEKQAEKKAKKAEKLAEKEAVEEVTEEKEAVEEVTEEVTEIYDEQEIQVIEFTYEDDEKYLRDNENQVYDYNTHEVIGIWNEETMKIEEFK